MITIQGFTERQIKIADFLWNCPLNSQQLNTLSGQDPEVRVVRDMIVAAELDAYPAVDLAEQVLQRYHT